MWTWFTYGVWGHWDVDKVRYPHTMGHWNEGKLIYHLGVYGALGCGHCEMSAWCGQGNYLSSSAWGIGT